ncbi:MAG: TRAP transporter small permease subunit [Dehalococcoidales bacterium]|nr:TRAP transporter small permease subunit [Dehalococcoidales bacterium]
MIINLMWRCCRAVDNLNKYIGLGLRWVGFVLVFILCYEVIARGVFNRPTEWAHEGSQYVFGLYFAVAGGFAMWYGGMVNVDILLKQLRPRARAGLQAATAIVTLIFLFAMVYVGSRETVISIMENEKSFTAWGPPIWPLKLLVFVGSLLLLLQSLANMTRDIILAATGKEPPK